MIAKSAKAKKPAEQVVKDIRRLTRRHFSAEDKIRIVLEGLRGEDSIAELCRKEGIAQSLYYAWSKDFLEAGKRRLAGDTARAATTDEVKDLRREAGALKECVADLTLENRLLKKRMARPACKRLFDGCSVCANVSGLGAVIVPGQDGAFARTNPHKDFGVERHFFPQDFGTPFDCQAIFSVHSQTSPA